MSNPNSEIQGIHTQQPRGFFIQVPALIDWLGLEPSSRVLYEHYLRVCSDHEWSEYTKTTAKFCEISERTVRTHRKKLFELGLIDMRIEGNIGDQRIIISVTDIWSINTQFHQHPSMLKVQNINNARLWLRSQIEDLKKPPHPPETSELPSLSPTIAPPPFVTPAACLDVPVIAPLAPIDTPIIAPPASVDMPAITPVATVATPVIAPPVSADAPIPAPDEATATSPEPSTASKRQAMRELASAIIDLIGGWMAKPQTLSTLTWPLVTWLWLWYIVHHNKPADGIYTAESIAEMDRIERAYPNLFEDIENMPAILIRRAAQAPAPLTQCDNDDLRSYLRDLAIQIEGEKQKLYTAVG